MQIFSGDQSVDLGDRGDELSENQGEKTVRTKEVPNFVVRYVSSTQNDINEFMDQWILNNSICLNFKLEQQINEPIGGRFKSKARRITKRNRSNTARQSDSGLNPDLTSDEDDQNISSQSSQCQEGLPLRLEIDEKRHIVTKLYACFDDHLTVYIVDNRSALQQIRNNLKVFLEESYASSTSSSATQRRQDFTPIELFTQSIVLTYKVLYAAFDIDQQTLFRHFTWHSFDVAWWMVNNCPNRGLNNCNSSLSLVANTKWALQYHHFLHPSSKKGKGRRRLAGQSPVNSLVPEVGPEELGRSLEDFHRLKDIVKSGKTAILKPLIGELLEELGRRKQLAAYYDSEITSRLVLAQVMVHGIGLDITSMRDELGLYQDLSDQLNDIAKRYYAKSDISLTNIRHVARVLYDDLDLKKHLLNHSTVSDITKDPTNAEILKLLSEYHPFPKLVQDFRKIGKALEALQSVSTYARYNSELDMMRVFGQCDFWQLTGRVSMFDPDLFLINRNFSVTIPEHGNRPVEIIECAPRRCFIPKSGWIFVAADYSQLELRLLAHFSNDENLLEILNRSLDSGETYDVFKIVASRIYRRPVDQVTSENRQHAKQICYGIIYGMGNRSLANQLGVDIEQAEAFRQDFFDAFPKIKTFADELVENCEQTRYVESLMGRRRTIEGFKSEHSSDRSRARRVAINTKIQSSASDIIKLSMKLVNQKVLEDYRHSARLCLEMHDELIYEINPSLVDKFSKMLRYTMENLGSMEELRVKLLVNLKKGTNWSNLEPFHCDPKCDPNCD